MATTRAKTGNAKPRVFPKIEEAVTGKKTTTANTSKPRAKKVSTGRVTKPAAEKKSPVTKKKTPVKAVADKVNGAVLKGEGKVEGKPAKKAAGATKAKTTTTKKAAPKTKAKA